MAEEEEEDDEDDAPLDAHAQQVQQGAAIGAETVQEDDEEEEEEADAEADPEVDANTGAEAEAEAEADAEGEEEEEADEEMADGEAPVASEPVMHVPAAAHPSGADAIVELPPAEAPQHQIVAASSSPGRSDSWSVLPPELNGQWTVSKDVCSLKIMDKVMKLPRSVYERLYGYQRQGVAWMWNLMHKGFGGILADEMGLGKTVQVAAFLACLKFTEQGSRFLVVVPVTLCEQWRNELSTWAGDTGLAVNVLHGSMQERRAALRNFSRKGGALVTSYDMMRNSVDILRFASAGSVGTMLPRKRKAKRGIRDDDSPSEGEKADVVREDLPWDVLIVDESHQIKNPSCVVGKDLRRVNSRTRFLLTGTPLQNKLIDMWALMDLAQPGLLGNHATFERDFSDQIARGSKKNASSFDVELKDQLAKELRRLTAPHFLRRLKDEVCVASHLQVPDAPCPEELPPKTDVVLWLNLTAAQLELYDLCLRSEIVRKATSVGGQVGGMEALRAIALLKKLCNHPLLCLPPEQFNAWREAMANGGNPVAAVAQGAQRAASSAAPAPAVAAGSIDSQMDMESTQHAPECEHMLPRLQSLVPGSVEAAALLSSKIRVLSVLLPQLQRRGHRCIIISHSVRMLDLIQSCCLRVLGLKFLRIDGSIDPKDRDLKLSKFHQEGSRYFAICLSAQVGGVGLTITGADRVILVDPAWNPAMDAQAIARVHRIGQKKDVVVYRLIGAGGIEDKMFRLQVFKRGLAKTALENGQQVRFFTSKELKTIFEHPSHCASTQALMAEQLGTEALEHEALLRTVAADVGGTDDEQALAFWQSSDVLGFSDYEKLFAYLEQSQSERPEEDVTERARELSERLRTEAYKTNQVVEGKWRAGWRDGKENAENLPPQEAALPVLQDA
eukprot:TRINITY_DN2413_c0_g11_i1.p1 TRINITY_DN2413_c0_g11~~TRINITY_DN2413_c0_g11_i1.p1  ORF type:complete len:1021 (-),score=217.97 TRINITY_DN2413_c0_g11_i1:654-3350(-)